MCVCVCVQPEVRVLHDNCCSHLFCDVGLVFRYSIVLGSIVHESSYACT